MRELHWSNSSRPAKRYLYFRFLMTYLIHKTKGQSTDWVDQIAAKGKMWCTPGPYLRRSMVQLLARECGDQFLPEVFYEQTFEDQALGRDEEKGMARDMRDRMVLSSSPGDPEDDSSEDSEYDSSENSDESEDSKTAD